MRLRSRLILLVIATAVPLVVLAVVASLRLIENEQANFVQAVKDRNRAFMSAVDAELKGHVTALVALTALPNLAHGNLAALHADLVGVQQAQPTWITILLHAPDGAQLLNTRVPYGEPLPEPMDRESVRQSATRQVPVIGGIVRGRVMNSFGVPVRVPVVRDGATVYVLTAVVDPTVFSRLILQQNLPDGWVSGLVDANFRFIARVPPREIGTLASDAYRQAIASAEEGWYRGATLEGLDTFTAFIRSDMTGWSVGFAIPAAVVLAGSHRVGWTMGAFAVICFTLALIVALWMGHRIAAPITRLALSAPRLGREDLSIDTRSSIREVRELASALAQASRAIADRDRVAELERKVLADSDRAKDDFIAMLSHEMRNPLAAITAASSLLRIGAPGSDVVTAAHGVIDRQTRQLGRLVEDLLDVSRIAMGKAVLDCRPFDLSEVAAGVLDTWRQSGKLAGYEVVTRMSPAWVNADRTRMEQVITNLVDNAVKFTSPGERISVTVHKDGSLVRLIVADTGAGIPAGEIDRVFDLFVQGGQDLSRSRGGIGVGLALVKRLVQMHGGTVKAESAGTDQGTTFTLELPAYADTAATRVPPTEEHRTQRARRLLLVEDSDDARSMLAAVLQARGHAVVEARDGRSALELAARHEFDVAIVDIGLPDMTGYDIARELRQRPLRRVPRLIALTGYGQPQDRERALAAGFDHHATKPLAAEDVFALLDEHRAAAT